MFFLKYIKKHSLTQLNMLTIYPQAKEAWLDYFNNGFKYSSKGTFIHDYIEFFKKNDNSSYIQCLIKFYEEKYPHFTILQMHEHNTKMTESEANEFFEYSPTKVQKAFIDFCYKSLEEHLFGPESQWISAEIVSILSY